MLDSRNEVEADQRVLYVVDARSAWSAINVCYSIPAAETGYIGSHAVNTVCSAAALVGDVPYLHPSHPMQSEPGQSHVFDGEFENRNLMIPPARTSPCKISQRLRVARLKSAVALHTRLVEIAETQRWDTVTIGSRHTLWILTRAESHSETLATRKGGSTHRSETGAMSG